MSHKIVLSILLIIGFNLITYSYDYSYDIKTTTVAEDRAEAAKYHDMVFDIAEKWYERGEMDIALEFGIEYYPAFVYEIWKERGDEQLLLKLLPAYDMETSSLGRDKFETKNLRPNIDIINKLDKLSEKWDRKGNIDGAAYFDYLYSFYFPKMLDSIVRKWTDRGKEEIALNIKDSVLALRDDPSIGTKIMDKLINTGHFAMAENFANELLEYWISQNDEKIRMDIKDKLALAAKIKSKHYFDILESKLDNPGRYYDIIKNYRKFLDNIPLSPENKDLSITDYLTHRAYVMQDFLTKYNISIEEARMMLEVDIYELIKKNPITFSILHVVALHAKEDSRYKLQIFYESPFGQTGEQGRYSPVEGIYTTTNPLRSAKIKETLAHEWTHQAMDIIFHNGSLPYARNDETAKIEFNTAMNRVLDQFKDLKQSAPWFFNREPWSPRERAIHIFNDIYLYNEDQREQEAIARFVGLIGSGDYDDPEVKEFLEPIYDYWMKYIEPAIQKYVKDHAAIDNFVSDWERENVLDPFYRAQVDVPSET